MDRFENLSRDNLRSEVSRLKVMRYNDMKKLHKQQLINVLRENQDNLHRIFPFHDALYHNYVERLRPQQNRQPRVREQQQQLKDIFPFEQSVFSNYKEFRDTVKETIYENQNKTNELHDYFERIRRRVIGDIKDVNVKIAFTLEVQMESLEQMKQSRFTLGRKIKRYCKEMIEMNFIQRLVMKWKIRLKGKN